MSKTLLILVGLPGCGKSTFLRDYPQAQVCSADHWFERDGHYHFDPSQLALAHTYCQGKADGLMAAGYPLVAIDNTNLAAWERKPYLDLAARYGYEIRFQVWEPDVDAVDGRNVHGVSRDGLERMAARFESPLEVARG